MTIRSKTDRLRDSAARLRREAMNCLSIAVGARDSDGAAQLIDEAERLIRRSAELGEMPG